MRRACAAIALLLVALLAAAHGAGWRENVAFLSGTPVPSPAAGVAYLLLHLLSWVVAPVLLVSVVVDVAVARALRVSRARAPARTPAPRHPP